MMSQKPDWKSLHPISHPGPHLGSLVSFLSLGTLVKQTGRSVNALWFSSISFAHPVPTLLTLLKLFTMILSKTMKGDSPLPEPEVRNTPQE